METRNSLSEYTITVLVSVAILMMNLTEDEKFHFQQQQQQQQQQSKDVTQNYILPLPPLPNFTPILPTPPPQNRGPVSDHLLDEYTTRWRRKKIQEGMETNAANNYVTNLGKWLEYALEQGPNCEPGIGYMIQQFINWISTEYVLFCTGDFEGNAADHTEDIEVTRKNLFTMLSCVFFYIMTINWYFLLVYANERNVNVRPLEEMAFIDLEPDPKNVNVFKKIFAMLKPYITTVDEFKRQQPEGETFYNVKVGVMVFNTFNFLFGLFFKPLQVMDHFIINWVGPGLRTIHTRVLAFYLIFLVFLVLIDEFCGSIDDDEDEDDEDENSKNTNEDYDLCGDPLQQPTNTGSGNNGCDGCTSLLSESIQVYVCIIMVLFWAIQSVSFIGTHIFGNHFLFRSIFILFIGFIAFVLLTGLRLVMAISDFGLWFSSTLLLLYLFGASFFGLIWYEGWQNFGTVFTLIKLSFQEQLQDAKPTSAITHIGLMMLLGAWFGSYFGLGWYFLISIGIGFILGSFLHLVGPHVWDIMAKRNMVATLFLTLSFLWIRLMIMAGSLAVRGVSTILILLIGILAYLVSSTYAPDLASTAAADLASTAAADLASTAAADLPTVVATKVLE